MKYILKKLFALIITLLIVSFLAFLAFSVIPGDPTAKILGMDASPEQVAALRAQLGLDRPVLIRYWEWLTNFIQGDFGTSYSYSQSVGEMLSDKLPVTAALTLMSFLFTVVLSIPLGILAGSVRSRVLDHIITVLDQIFMSVPQFFIGILMCFTLGLTFRFFVPGEFVSYTQSWPRFLYYMMFPALAIAIPRIAMTVKMLRGSIRSELSRDYVRTSQSRGSARRTILSRHVVRNAMIPVITFLAISMAEIMTGTIVVEQVFTVPGIGRLLISSISNRDFPVVQAIVVILAAWIVLVNFLADVINQLVDPRIRLQ